MRLVWFGLVWFGLVWFGLVWFGLVWFGLVWFGLVWFGLVCYALLVRFFVACSASALCRLSFILLTYGFRLMLFYFKFALLKSVLSCLVLF
jgi:hypothetical protein